MTTVTESKLRTGILILGPTSSATEFSCQATSVIIASSYKESGDPVEVLCGTKAPAETTVAKSLKINAIQDFDNPDGLMHWLRLHELETQPFSWQANPTSQVATGTLQVRLGDWGGEVGKRLSSAPEMPIIELDWAEAPPLATGATAGTPGTFTPAGSRAPWDLARMADVVATPATAWATGEHVMLGDASVAHWDASDWTDGVAP